MTSALVHVQTVISRRIGRRTLGALSVVVLGLLLTGTGATPAAAEAVNQSKWSGVAIEGTDPVAYFIEGKPVEGSSDYSLDWNGATWRFANQANLDAFQAEPQKFAPQYGGYCAWAVSQGYSAPIDPAAWHIRDNKLYLNYSKDVQQTWSQDIAGNIRKADVNWPSVRAALTD